MSSPERVVDARHDQLIATRQARLDAAYAAHPERFVHGRPSVARPPAVAAINPLEPEQLPVSASALLAELEVKGSPEAIAT